MTTGNFVCQKCGAGLSMPTDPSAVSARCQYCNTDTMLPQQVLAARQAQAHAQAQQAQAQSRSSYGGPPMIIIQPPGGFGTDSGAPKRALWIVLITTLLPLLMAGGIAYIVNSQINNTMKSVMPHHGRH